MIVARLPFLLVGVLLIAATTVACNPFTGSTGDTAAKYYNGDLRPTASASSGPLRLQVVRVTYAGGSSKQSGGRTYEQVAQTDISLRLRNSGRSSVLLPGLSGGVINVPPGGTPPVMPSSYYLVDAQGHRFNATGSGLTLREGQQWDGKVHPGQTVEFSLGFGPIPTTVKALTLVLEDLKSESGGTYTLRVQVPLPGTTTGTQK